MSQAGRAAIVVAAVIVAALSTAVVAAAERPVTVVISAEVAWVDPPARFGLVDGTVVELAEPSPLLDELARARARDEAATVRVVGRRLPGRAGGVVSAVDLEILPPGSGRRTPLRRSVATKDGTTLDGTFVALTADGFTLDVDGTVYQAVVTPATELRDFDDLTQLESGDLLEVRGELVGLTITADRVRLLSGPDITSLHGVVAGFTADGLMLDDGSSTTHVVVTAETVFQGFVSLSDLSLGDEIEAKGVLAGSVLTATEIELFPGGSGGDGGGVDFESRGRLVDVRPPDRFTMDDGRGYRVDAATVYDTMIGSYGGLERGQYLKVDAVRTAGGDNLALEIEFEGDVQGGQGYVELAGTVVQAGPTSIELDDGTVVAIVPTTLFTGDADSWSDVVPGWSAEIEALLALTGSYIAIEVRAEDPEPATVSGQDFEPQQALVVPTAGADGADIAARFGAQVAGRVGDLAVLLWWPDPIDDPLLAALTADPEIAAVEPNYLFRDPESVRRRYPTVDRQATTAELVGQSAVHQVRMPEAHQLGDGRGIVVAVMDTGVDPLHPVLRRRLLAGGLDLVDGDLRPWEARNGVDDDGDGDVDEAAGHGTFVASLIAVAAPGASILPYRVLDDDGGGTAYDLALALADALHRRVDVINLSLVYQERSTAVDLLLERAAELGIVVVTSAGNDGLDALPFPASDSHALAVAAARGDGLGLAAFSNRSAAIAVAAPGEEVYGGLDEGGFGTSSGTSMAAPFVSATVALLLSADPGLDPALVRNALGQSGVPIQDGAWTGVTLDMAAAAALVSGP